MAQVRLKFPDAEGMACFGKNWELVTQCRAANVVGESKCENIRVLGQPVSQSAASSLFQLTLIVVAKLVAAKLEIIIKRWVFKCADHRIAAPNG